MHEVLVNRLGGLSLPRKSVVRLTDRPDMTLDVYRGRKTTKQQQQLYRTGVNKKDDLSVTSQNVTLHLSTVSSESLRVTSPINEIDPKHTVNSEAPI